MGSLTLHHSHPRLAVLVFRQSLELKNQRGFTLIEVVLALVLLIGLVGVTLAMYQQVLAAKQSTFAYVDRTTGMEAAMDRITSELRHAFNAPGEGQMLEGEADSIRIVTTRLPGAVVWMPPSTTTGSTYPPEQDLMVVSYALQMDTTSTDEPIVAGLQRSVQKLLTAKVVQAGETVQSELMTPEVKFIAFRYFDGSSWLDSWQQAALPAGVEVTLGAQPLPEGVDPQDYPYDIARRIVYLPGSVNHGGTLIRGLGEGR